MKMISIKLCLAILTIGVPITTAAHLRSQHLAISVENATGTGTGAGGLEAALSSMVAQFLQGEGPALRDIVAAVHSKMGIVDAVKELDGKLPTEVASLVRTTLAKKDKSAGKFSEASLQKAREILNGMILSAWGDLDDIVIECKEFSEKNRDTFGQVDADLTRIGFNLAKLTEDQLSASEGIRSQMERLRENKELFGKAEHDYLAQKSVNDKDMIARKNDLAVFNFVLNLTRCTQEEDQEPSFMDLGAKRSPIQICSTHDGLELNFDDLKLQAQVEKMMTPSARLALRRALGQLPMGLALAQAGKREANLTTTLPIPAVAVEILPVSEEPNPEGQYKKCVDGKPDCGILHDLMSLEWGKFKDALDELSVEMKKNQDRFHQISGNSNAEQIQISDSKTDAMELLAEVVSQVTFSSEEKQEKLEQKHALTKEFEKKTSECKASITEILFSRICAFRKVRNELMSYSSIAPPSNISDCDFTDWKAPKDGLCIGAKGTPLANRCDDSCPQPDPSACGGYETITRDVLVRPNSNGMQCPSLSRRKKCGQKKCPVNCVMSRYSDWSKCSKGCGTGVKTKTRSIIVQPKNGGASCDTVSETITCNTGSCTRDCVLNDWSSWTPCSMACSGGIKTRSRSVLTPIRGEGKCPKAASSHRLEKEQCNTQDCMPDQMCIAKQDLILAIDGSGSITEEGFEVLKAFTANLTDRYHSTYFGEPTMKVGVVLFGNGAVLLEPDGTTRIADAIWHQGLTDDMSLVRKQLLSMKYQGGFTNMAQALAKANVMLQQGGRSQAQSAVMVISDGKYTMRYQTAQQVQKLKDKNIQIFMAPVTTIEGKELDSLKNWASQPWEANYVRLPGLVALKQNADIFAQKLVAAFCPDSMSPTLLRQHEAMKQYIIIREGGFPSTECGKPHLIGNVASKDDCAAASRELGLEAFSFGKAMQEGRCYAVAIPVTQQHWVMWSSNRTSVPCEGGAWLDNPFFDVFAIEPVGA